MLLILFTIVFNVIKNGDFNDINDIHKDINRSKWHSQMLLRMVTLTTMTIF